MTPDHWCLSSRDQVELIFNLRRNIEKPEELAAHGTITGGALLGSQVYKRSGRSYQMKTRSEQRAGCSLHTKFDMWNL